MRPLWPAARARGNVRTRASEGDGVRAIPLSWMVAGVIATTAVLVGASLVLFAAHEFRETRDREFSAAERTAQLLALFAGGDVVADARDQGAKDLATLRHHPDMASAWLYDRTGRPFASWHRDKAVAPPPLHRQPAAANRPTARLLGDAYIEVQAPIDVDEKPVGTLQLLVSAAPLHQHVYSFWVMLTAIGLEMLLWLAVIFVVIQRFVARPTLQMAATAVQISKSGNYALRLNANGGPELGLLRESFNDVLAAVEQRERQRDQAEAALLASPVGIAIESVADRRVRFVNEAMVHLMGVPRGEMLGHVSSELGLPDVPTAGHPALQSGRESFTVRDVERTLHTPAGERHVALFINPIRYGGEPCRVAYFYDITERRQLEVIRRQLENDAVKRLQEANRAKNAFLANMSHELRTPLNAIIGFGELLEAGEVGPVAAQQKEFLGDIVSSGRHLLTLISDILDVSKVEAGKMQFQPEELDLAKVCRDAVEVLRASLARKGLRVRCRIDPELTTVTLDPARFKQVLYNFLSNAVKFSPEGCEVTVSAVARGEALFRLQVEDLGPGIAPEDLPLLFKAFQQLDDSAAKQFAGTGLGLALTKHLVEAQGGYVGVRSAPGEGSAFFAVLPRRATRTAGTDTPELSAVLLPQDGAPTVLVVEPDADEGTMMARTLVAAGYGVQLAGTGAAALRRLQTWQFEAITLACLLPDANGPDLLPTIRQIAGYGDTPIVIVTAVQELCAAGLSVHEVVPKPVSGQRLIASLARAGVVACVRPVQVVDDASAPPPQTRTPLPR